jgi:hypothetical protein
MTLDNLPTSAIAIGAAAVGGIALLAWLLLLWRRYRTRRALVARFESLSFAHLRDVLLPDGGGGSYHIDFLLLTPTGLLVVDLRDVPGVIFGSEQMNEWTVMHRERRTTFLNPLGPLYDRIAIVRALAGEDVPVDGRVVFSERSSFPKGRPPLVTRLGSIGAEFPAAAVAGGVPPAYQSAWDRVSAAASPSPMNRR